MDRKIERLCAALFLAAKDHREIMMNSVYTEFNFENVGAIAMALNADTVTLTYVKFILRSAKISLLVLKSSQVSIHSYIHTYIHTYKYSILSIINAFNRF